MSKYPFYLGLFALLYCCIGKYDSNAQKAIATEQNRHSTDQWGDTLQIKNLESNIYWKGTKMSGSGKHEGEVELQKGYFISRDGRLAGGNFVVDMSTIGVIDIPLSDPIPIRNINEHLKSRDFFDVEKFPISEFHITRVEQMTVDSLLVSGNLTLKNITKHMVFGAKYQNNTFSTKFKIDRLEWNVAYKGSWAAKTMVDRDIEMKIILKIE